MAWAKKSKRPSEEGIDDPALAQTTQATSATQASQATQADYWAMEEKSKSFVDKNCENQPEREVKSEARIKEDNEELQTFALLSFNSLETGEKIDA